MTTTHLSHRGTHAATPHQLAWLRSQLDAWRAEGLVDEDAATAIWSRYRATRRVSVGRLLLALGSGFVGVGLIWLVAANLDQLPPLVRFVAVASIWLTLLVVGEVLAARRRAGSHLPAGLLGGLRLVAALAFGAVVFQAAQSVQVPAYEPKLVGFWAAGALLHAYVVRSVAPLLVGLVAGSVWFVWQVVDSAPSGFALVLALLAAAAVGLGVAAVHDGRLPRFAVPYREIGVALGLAGLFAAALPFVTADVEWSGWLVAAAAAGTLAVVAGAILAEGRQRLEPLAAAAVAAVGIGLVLWDTGTDTDRLGALDWLHALAGVAAYVVVAVGVAVLGTLRDSWRLTALATVAIVAFTTVQSFAVFARIIEGAWLFVVLGLVFCGTGFGFDRARRGIAAAIEGEER
jgi:uncharacterized membrane protein